MLSTLIGTEQGPPAAVWREAGPLPDSVFGIVMTPRREMAM